MNPISKQESCCCDRPQKGDHSKRVCPVNGKKGQSIDAETLRHLIKKERVHEIKDAGYYFCKEPDCDTVYYHPEGSQTFEKTDLNVRVGLKETEDPVWVCYCFDISKKMIREEIENTGHSVSGNRIHQEVANDNCECEIKNPAGRCCLGEVLMVEKEVQKYLRKHV